MKTQLNLLNEDALVVICQEQLPYVPNAYEELIKRYQQKVFYLCKRYLTIESDAEDATQEVFMKVFHTLPRFDHRSTFTTWLFSVVTNHCKTMLSKRKLHNQRYEYGNDKAQEEFLDDSNSQEQDLKNENERENIQELLHKMKSDEQDMIMLRFTSELPLNDIAKITGKKLSATKMRFYRALEKFKGLYEADCLF